jgi:hypothetical protein
MRPARIVADLPTSAIRLTACDEATDAIARLLGQAASRRIAFGLSVFTAFMTAPEAKRHP